jgi:hypothetical protein
MYQCTVDIKSEPTATPSQLQMEREKNILSTKKEIEPVQPSIHSSINQSIRSDQIMRVPHSHIIIKFLLGMLCVMLACDCYGALGESEAVRSSKKLLAVCTTSTVLLLSTGGVQCRILQLHDVSSYSFFFIIFFSHNLCAFFTGWAFLQQGTVPRKMKPVGVTMTNTMTGQTQQQQRPHVRIEYCTS